MKIKLNGKWVEVEDKISIKKLLEEFKILDKVMAVAVNMEIVKKENWEEFRLKEEDEIEALTFVGGG